MAYLLDTNLIQKRPLIVAKVASAGGLSNLSVAAITAAELRYGVERMLESRRKENNLASLFTILEGLEIRPFNEDAAAAFGWAAALLEQAGVAFSFPDLAIASIALVEDMTVASNDGFFEHVQRICELKFERWEPYPA